MTSLLALAVALLLGGLVLGDVDTALLSLLPLVAYAANAALPPPSVTIRRTREGSQVVVEVFTSRHPGVLEIYQASTLAASVTSRKWSFFKPPFKRRVEVRYRQEEPGAAPLLVISYNPAYTRWRIAMWSEEPKTAAEPPSSGMGLEEFAELRPYSPGDPARFINWKAFAKTGELYVNKFQGPEPKNAVIIVDARRLKNAVVTTAVKAAEILAERGYQVSYYILGHGPAPTIPKDFEPKCVGNPPCGDLAIYVGSLHDLCIELKCPKALYLDVAASNPLAAIKRLSLYRKLKAASAEVIYDVDKLKAI